MSLPDLSHLDPDLIPILQGLDTRIAGLERVLPPPPVDLTAIDTELADHEKRITALENPPVIVIPPNTITWKTIPTIIATQGVPTSVDVTLFVSNSFGLPLTITLSGPPLPQGWSFDGKRFNYNGTGAVATVSGFSLTADDGRTP